MPQPTIPTTMRSDGAGWSSLPSALAGMMVGAATAAAVVAINRRREIPRADGEVFIPNNYGRSAVRARAENASIQARVLRGALLDTPTIAEVAPLPARHERGEGGGEGLVQSRKFWKLTATGKSWARMAAMTACNSSLLLLVTRISSP